MAGETAPCRAAVDGQVIQFRWHETKIRLDFSFFAAAALLGLLGGTGGFLRMLAACILHEAGHLAVMLLLRQRVRSITCYGVGICIRPASYGTYGQDVLVLLAGPLCNLFMGAGIWLTAGMTPFAMLHLGLGLFNLLPYAQLDGGAVLCALLLAGNVTPRTAEQVRSGLCLLLTVVLLWLAICHGVTNLTFYGMLLYLLVTQFFVSNGKPHRIAS